MDSVPAAKKVKSEIIKASKKLNLYPEKYQLDEYYPNNPGNIRRFFRWSYRIIYQVNNETIDILITELFLFHYVYWGRSADYHFD